MRLSTWEDEGVEIGRFLGTPMWRTPDGTLHGDRLCDRVEHDEKLVYTFLSTGDEEVCDMCWDETLDSDAAEVAWHAWQVHRAPTDLKWSLEQGVAGKGFSEFVRLWKDVPAPEELRPWFEKNREVLRTHLRAARANPEPVHHPDDGLLYISTSEYLWAIERLPLGAVEVVAEYWLEDSPLRGVLVRAHPETIHWLDLQLQEAGMTSRHYSTVLLEGDSAETVETALGLLDESSEELRTLPAALRAARSV